MADAVKIRGLHFCEISQECDALPLMLVSLD